jgi:hypothetical protein
MRRRALLCLAGWAAAGIAACSGPGTVAAPPASPRPAAQATTTVAPGGSATAVANGYYRAVAARDYRLAFSYLAAGSTGPDGRTLTLQEFLQLAGTMDSEQGPVVDYAVAAFGDLVVMTIDRQEGGRYHAHLQIGWVADRWAITSIDRI